MTALTAITPHPFLPFFPLKHLSLSDTLYSLDYFLIYWDAFSPLVCKFHEDREVYFVHCCIQHLEYYLVLARVQ